MLLWILYACFSLLTDLALVRGRPGWTRDVELLALRHEVRVLRRRAKRPAWTPGDRFVLALLGRCLPRAARSVLPVRPETVLRWHRELVRRTWAAVGRRRGPGRPPLPADAPDLLGHDVSATAIRAIPRRCGVPPAPRRAELSWRAFLRAHAGAVLECDVFTVETVRLRTLHVLVFLEVHARRVFVAGCTVHPSAAWVTQQARQLCWRIDEAGRRPTVVVRDRDATFRRTFDDVFRSEGVRVVRAPFRAPRARAHAERWVGTVRRECLDWLLIVGERHLGRVLREYAVQYNAARPHRALQLRSPVSRGQPVSAVGEIVRRDRLGGLVHEYERLAA